MQILEIRTPQRVAFVPITGEVQSVVTEKGWQDGILTLYVPHTTAGITINENADPDVVRDILHETNKLIPLKTATIIWKGIPLRTSNHQSLGHPQR